MMIRVPAPSDEQVKDCIYQVCVKEKVKASGTFMNRLVEKASGNVRRALLLLEGTVAQRYRKFLLTTS